MFTQCILSHTCREGNNAVQNKGHEGKYFSTIFMVSTN